jgi:hypothetical protein
VKTHAPKLGGPDGLGHLPREEEDGDESLVSVVISKNGIYEITK